MQLPTWRFTMGWGLHDATPKTLGWGSPPASFRRQQALALPLRSWTACEQLPDCPFQSDKCSWLAERWKIWDASRTVSKQTLLVAQFTLRSSCWSKKLQHCKVVCAWSTIATNSLHAPSWWFSLKIGGLFSLWGMERFSAGMESYLGSRVDAMAAWHLVTNLWYAFLAFSYSLLCFQHAALPGYISLWKLPVIGLDLDCCLKLVFQCLVSMSIYGSTDRGIL